MGVKLGFSHYGRT